MPDENSNSLTFTFDAHAKKACPNKEQSHSHHNDFFSFFDNPETPKLT